MGSTKLAGRESPIFIIGRQHSGNTMLASIFERVPEVLSLKGEGQFFEFKKLIEELGRREQITRIIELIAISSERTWPRKNLKKVENELVANDQSQLGVADLYIQAMSYLARQQGSTTWAQKATSYIFHVEDILKFFPTAKLIFLARNPLDLAASLKRRGHQEGYLRMILGWNKSFKLAQKYKRKYPDNFLIMRYEDLVSQPKKRLKKIFDFTNLEFKPDYLHIGHVNPSESPYTVKNKKGITSDRAYYYSNVLSTKEIQVLKSWVSEPLLDTFYPEIDLSSSKLTFAVFPYSLRLVASGIFSIFVDSFSIFYSDPKYLLTRIWKRIFK